MFLSRFVPRTAALARVSVARTDFQRTWIPRAYYAAGGGGLTRDVITARMLETLSGFEKIDPAKLTPTSSFRKDLGLDSLDAVEIIVSVETEFSIEIPDSEADEILTVAEAIDYIAKTPEAH